MYAHIECTAPSYNEYWPEVGLMKPNHVAKNYVLLTIYIYIYIYIDVVL